MYEISDHLCSISHAAFALHCSKESSHVFLSLSVASSVKNRAYMRPLSPLQTVTHVFRLFLAVYSEQVNTPSASGNAGNVSVVMSTSVSI